MNYIYDIVLNFQDNYYNFFEWKKEDNIKNINKIPIFHISDEDLLSLKNNEIILDNPFLSKILEKNTIFLVSNTNITIGLLINEQGMVLKKSSLLFDEEEEANEISQKLPLTQVNYKKNTPKKEINKLRIEIEKKASIIKYIKESTNLITLKYIYYEYFNKESNNINNIKETLIKELKSDWNNKQKKLYTIINILKNNQLIN